MPDMGGIEGSVEATSGGGNQGQGNNGSDGGVSAADIGNALDVSNMTFGGSDALSLGGAALAIGTQVTGVGGVLGGGLMAGSIAGLATGSNPATALGHLAQSASQGLGAAVTANPSFNMFGADMSPADFSGGPVGTSENLGGGVIAEFSAGGSFLGTVPDPSYWASVTGSNGSEGGGNGSEGG